MDTERFRDALSRWATGVTVVAVRDDDRVYATTVTSFASLSVEPPLVLVTLGPGAQVLPFLEGGRRFVVNVLASDQRRLAAVFADAYPVGPSPFSPEGDPVLDRSHAILVCAVDRVLSLANGVRLVLGLVHEAELGAGERPLLRHARGYHRLDD